MTPDQQHTQAIAIADRLAARASHRSIGGWWTQMDELTSVAREAALAALRPWRRTSAAFNGYIHRAAAYALARWVRQQGSPVSARHRPQVLEGTITVRGSAPHAVCDDDLGAAADGQARLRHAVRAEIGRTKGGRLAVRVLLDGHTAQQVANEAGIPVWRVYNHTMAARRALRESRRVRRIYDEVTKHE